MVIYVVRSTCHKHIAETEVCSVPVEQRKNKDDSYVACPYAMRKHVTNAVKYTNLARNDLLFWALTVSCTHLVIHRSISETASVATQNTIDLTTDKSQQTTDPINASAPGTNGLPYAIQKNSSDGK